jgi:hypothetical protein
VQPPLLLHSRDVAAEVVVLAELAEAGGASRTRVQLSAVAEVGYFARLGDDRLMMDLDGTAGPVVSSEQELSRAIIEATVDEADFSGGRTRLTKYLNETE